MEKLIFEYSKEGKIGYSLPEFDYKEVEQLIPDEYLRIKEAELPEVSEPEVVRHFIKLSTLNHHVDKDFYPLGSCTMKYNPKINEKLASLSGFTELHPLQDESSVQGALQIMYELEKYLCEITGMNSATLQPAAGSHGELTGVMIMKKYHNKKGENREYILVPDSAHGTNPSSVSSCGFKALSLKTDENGMVDLEDLKEKMNENVAGLMLTNPNTLGIFEENVEKLSEIVHSYDGIMYMDGANLNALLGIVRPGDMGFDIVHINLHKTFSTPHGGGGPGSGPIAVSKRLEKFLPVPRIVLKNGKYSFDYNRPDSIGKVLSFYGNFGIIVRAYVYIRMMGIEGLKKASKNAIINANYLKEKIKKYYEVPYDRPCMHEFVASGKNLKRYGVRTLDIAKRILDFGMHAPTIYFPLIVPEALMIEPAETESKETLDRFIDVMIKIRKEAEENPDLLHEAPHNTPVSRVNDLKANKELKVNWYKDKGGEL
ncbi:MAG: aminomethyl-transferring glycine dehydrogenase subunit GcvPB [Candidatus Marinimicrobia bacterium]|nr:aminomethyl-transferring glycine dehydrogenase subunit GcvPB [Candidatus Neomarinimicrobiota bacterium]